MSVRLLFLGCGAVSALSACGVSGGRSPDEFRIVTKAPLEIPPEYNLRPPPTGSSTPTEIAEERTNQAVSFGQELGADASLTERILVSRAGAQAVSPVIRSVVDYEETGVLRKSRSNTDAILDYEGQAILDDSATGGEAVTIDSSDVRRVKLPGT